MAALSIATLSTAARTTHYGCSYHQGFDGLDAFLGHTWAVTVTGAPKPWATT